MSILPGQAIPQPGLLQQAFFFRLVRRMSAITTMLVLTALPLRGSAK
jgi:hypothetical protein